MNTLPRRLPRLMLVTSRRIMHPSFHVALQAALQGGARWIQLREKELARDELMDLAQRAQRLCAQYGAMLSINAHVDTACSVGASGMHLPEHGTGPRLARMALQDGALIGQSIHSAQAAQCAAQEGADYLVFGSVFPSASHPGGTAQGLEGLREVTAATQLPVFAIGGIDAARIKSCREAGAYGVAVLGAAWAAADVRQAVSALVQSVEEASSP